jgi:hypothetical protein
VMSMQIDWGCRIERPAQRFLSMDSTPTSGLNCISRSASE